MGHEHLACAVVELMQIRETPSGADRAFHHPPEAFDGVEVVPTMGGQKMEAKLLVVVVERCVELVRPVDPAPVNDHHDLFVRFAEDCHHLVNILSQLLGIKMWDDLIEDFGGPILDGAKHAEQHAAGDTAPGAILYPGLAFEGLLTFDLALAQGPRREARALGFAPPARAGQGKAPQDGFVFVEQNDLTTACPILQGGEFE